MQSLDRGTPYQTGEDPSIEGRQCARGDLLDVDAGRIALLGVRADAPAELEALVEAEVTAWPIAGPEPRVESPAEVLAEVERPVDQIRDVPLEAALQLVPLGLRQLAVGDRGVDLGIRLVHHRLDEPVDGLSLVLRNLCERLPARE